MNHPQEASGKRVKERRHTIDDCELGSVMKRAIDREMGQAPMKKRLQERRQM